MYIYSVKASKVKLVIFCAVLVIAAAAIALTLTKGEPASTDSGISHKAGSAAERLAFISQFGWEVSEDPKEVAEVIIPAEFDDIYTSYNEIQQEQELDLTPYKGLRAKRWTYEVLNYPGYEGKPGAVEINLLVYDGAVIGGDVCSLELNGFMHGFDGAGAHEAPSTALNVVS